MDTIEYALREAYFPALFGGEEDRSDLREILGHSVKHGVLCIPDPRLLEERTYNTYKASREVLVGSLLGGTDLNYVAHKFFVRRPSADGLKQREFLEMTAMTRRKDLADGVGLNRLRRATYNGARRTAIPHCLNGTELSREEFQYNLLLRYGIVPFKLPTDCDGCEKKFLLPHAIS